MGILLAKKMKIRDSGAYSFAETCLHHNVLGEVFAPEKLLCSKCTGLQQEEDDREEDFVLYITTSNTVKVNEPHISDLELLVQSCQSYYLHCLVATVYVDWTKIQQ